MMSVLPEWDVVTCPSTGRSVAHQAKEKPLRTDLRQVAERSGVSVSTASRALAGSTVVSSSTRLRVEEAARALAYRPNASARTLRTTRSRLIGLVITNLVNSSLRVIAEIVQQRFDAAGYQLVLCISGGDAEQESRALRTLMDLDVCGVVAVGSNNTAFAELRAGAIPVIHLGRRPTRLVGDCVLGDEAGGAAAATRHLLENGHRRIAIICGPASITSGRERLRGYQQALRAAGLVFSDRLVVSGPLVADTGSAAVDSLLGLPRSRRPTGLVVANSEAVQGVLPRLGELKVTVPQQLSIVCYEDAPITAWWHPPISVIDSQPASMAELVARLLLEQVADSKATARKPTVYRIATRLVERSSVGPPPRHHATPMPVAGTA